MSFPRYPAYKDSGVEWLGEVPEHWELSRLGFEAWVRARLGWKGLKAEEYVDDGFVFLSTPNIKGREINFDDVNFISQARYDESPEIKLSRGDVLLAKDGSTLGICNVIRSLPCPATVNSSVAVITPSPRLDSVYLHYLISGNGMQQLIQQKKGGMGVPHLFQADLVKFTVPLPTPNEQSSIATFLDRETAKIDALIAEQQRLIELLQEKRQAVISHAVTKGLNPDAPMKDSGVEWLGEVPEHWRIKRIKHTARMESGHTPDRKIEAYWINCDIPWVSLNDTSFLRDNDYISETAYSINELGIQNSSARLLPERVVVFSRDATIGRCAITTRPMAVSQHFIAWVCGDEILPEYLLLRLKSMTQELERLTFGATLKTIGMPDVKTLATPVPPMDEQELIVEYVKGETLRLEEMRESAQYAVALLQERRSALISAAVTGQIDVRGLVPEASAA